MRLRGWKQIRWENVTGSIIFWKRWKENMNSSTNGYNCKTLLIVTWTPLNQPKTVTKISKESGKFCRKKRDFSEWRWWVKELITPLGQLFLLIQVWTLIKLDSLCLWPKNSLLLNLSMSTILKSSSHTLLMGRTILEPTSFKKMEDLSNFNSLTISRDSHMLVIFWLITKIKLYTDI